jgi:hypothetical protein
MKSIKKILFIVVCGVMMTLSSCADYLDVSSELEENLTLDQVFENTDYTKRWYANIFTCIATYEEMGNQATSGFTGVWNCFSGDIVGKGPQESTPISGYNAKDAGLHRWANQYKVIRQALIFEKYIKPLGTIEDKNRITEAEANRMKAESKFFRAYCYISLFELYGPVPIVDEITDPNNQNIDFPRASVDEMVNYIDALLDEVITSNHLPETIFQGANGYNLNEMVRPTKATAMALRAKLWVFAASPLYNGGFEEALKLTNTDGKRLFPDYDAQKWQTAKKHLEDFISFADAQGFKLYEAPDNDPHNSVYNLFQDYNSEIIWATGDNHYNSYVGMMAMRTTPRGLYNAYGNVGVSQGMVDDFFMDNGLGIDDAGSGYREDGFVDIENVCSSTRRVDKNIFNMYANREPRFYAAITYQGKSWHIQPTGKADYTVGFARGQAADISTDDNPRSGYMPYKFKNRTLLNTGSYPKNYARPNILLRLADFYLYYAEVCNEINPNDPNVIEYLDKVRVRAGIPGYKELATTGKKNIIGNQGVQRKAIQKERRVELFCEGQRYFDIHRWMICGPEEDADQTVFRGMNMKGYDPNMREYADAAGTYSASQKATFSTYKTLYPIGNESCFYTRIDLHKRVWHKGMYFYPVPYNEIQKSRLLVQNPLW